MPLSHSYMLHNMDYQIQFGGFIQFREVFSSHTMYACMTYTIYKLLFSLLYPYIPPLFNTFSLSYLPTSLSLSQIPPL